MMGWEAIFAVVVIGCLGLIAQRLNRIGIQLEAIYKVLLRRQGIELDD